MKKYVLANTLTYSVRYVKQKIVRVCKKGHPVIHARWPILCGLKGVRNVSINKTAVFVSPVVFITFIYRDIATTPLQPCDQAFAEIC